MLILAVDTTTSCGSTALLNNNRLLGEINLDSPETHSERLLPAIHFLLDSFGKTIHDIDGYALAAGPGSFTGIRIGMSLIKSFVYASGKPAAPVSTLQALAEKMNDTRERLFCPILDARKGEVYSALYERRNKKELILQGVYKPDALFLRFPVNRAVLFLGDAAKLYRDKIKDHFKDKARFSTRSL